MLQLGYRLLFSPQISQTKYSPILIPNSCVADNSLGRSKKYMELSGRPGPAEFHSAPWSKSPDSYNLTWKVDSYPPLQEVRLLYRKLMVMMMITEKSPSCEKLLSSFLTDE
jgi:hypothetical protein